MRTRRIAPSRIMEIDHSQVWTALQLTHCPALRPFGKESILVGGDDEQLLVYLPRYRAAMKKKLREVVAQAPAVMLYSWQPELIRSELTGFTHVQVEAVPDSLANRFRIKV